MQQKINFNRKRMYITAKKLVQAKSFSGLFLVLMAITAMLLANSFFSEQYFSLLNLPIGLNISDMCLSIDAKHWVNDVLMTFFFMLAGLEIKRALQVGELSSLQMASFPVMGALGGMIMPTLIYILFNTTEYQYGFAIPMATDIAFALGLLLLLGNRIPISLKLFLVALAIVDDLGAVIVIALFYSDTLNIIGLALSVFTLFLMYMLNLKGVKSLLPYMLLGFLLWNWFHMLGIHASVSGVLIAFTIPIRAAIDTNSFLRRLKLRLNYFESLEQKKHEKMLTERQIGALDIMGHSYELVQSPMIRLEHHLIPISAFLVMPTFAFFNAGVELSSVNLSLLHPVSLGIIFGLVIGKPLGIFGAVFISQKIGIAKKPENLRWVDVFGVSILGGVGFTMSIFVGDLAFTDQELLNLAKLSVILASMISGIIGMIWLYISIVADKPDLRGEF